MGFTKYNAASEFEETFLMRDSLICVFSADSKYVAEESVTLTELAMLPYISLNEGVDDEITDVIKEREIMLTQHFIESNDHAVVAMVEQGLGASLMSQMMVEGFSHKFATVPLSPPTDIED